MTRAEVAAPDRAASRRRDTRKRVRPARANEPFGELGEARGEARGVRRRPPNGLGRVASEEHDARAKARRARDELLRGERVDVELERVRIGGRTARALVVHDVDGPVRPGDEQVDAPAEGERPAFRV